MNTCGVYLLEAPRWSASNEYLQHMLSWRNKKNINTLYFFVDKLALYLELFIGIFLNDIFFSLILIWLIHL